MRNKAGYLRDVHLAAEWLTTPEPVEHEDYGLTARDLARGLADDYGIAMETALEHIRCAINRAEGCTENPRDNGR